MPASRSPNGHSSSAKKRPRPRRTPSRAPARSDSSRLSALSNNVKTGHGVPSWTLRYFGPLYAELYGKHLLTKRRTQLEVRFATRVLALRGKRVLDLASGSGRHA